MSRLRGWATAPRVRLWAQVAVMVALFALAGVYIAGRRDDLDVIRNVSVGYAAVLTLLGGVALVWNGLFLRHMMRVFDIRLSILESTAITVISTIFNYLLPVVGGAGARGLYLKRRHDLPYAFYLSSFGATFVLGVGLAAMVGLLAASLLYLRDDLFSPVLVGTLAGIFAVTLVLGLTDVKIPRSRWKPMDYLGDILQGWRQVRSNLRVIATLVAIVFLLLATTWAALLTAFLAVDVEVGVFSALMLAALAELTILISVTPGALGVREAVVVFSATALGVDTFAAVIAAVLLRLTSLVANLLLALGVGIVVYKIPRISFAAKEGNS